MDEYLLSPRLLGDSTSVTYNDCGSVSLSFWIDEQWHPRSSFVWCLCLIQMLDEIKVSKPLCSCLFPLQESASSVCYRGNESAGQLANAAAAGHALTDMAWPQVSWAIGGQ